MATEEMTYCEGCSAKIPLKISHCPYCGIDKPYFIKYSHEQSTSIPSFSSTSSTEPISGEGSRSASFQVNRVNTPRASSSQTSSYGRYPSAVQTSSGKLEKSTVESILLQAVNGYNEKAFQKACDLTDSNKLLDWRAGIIYALSSLCLIESQESETELEYFTCEILLALAKQFHDLTLKHKLVENSIASFVIHRATTFAINNLGTELVFQKTSNSGSCVFKNGNYFGYHLLRLRSYVDVLQGIYDLSFSANLSSTIIFLSTLIIRLESGCKTGISTTRLKALRLSHKEKCTNPQFLKALEMSNHSIKMSFLTKPLKISSEAPLDRLVTRSIAYSLG
jgi:hypothetical protein